jgi:hypothetical protein
VDPSIERTLLSAIVLIGGGALVWHFDASTAIIALVGPTWGVVVGFWFRLNGTAAAAREAAAALKAQQGNGA